MWHFLETETCSRFVLVCWSRFLSSLWLSGMGCKSNPSFSPSKVSLVESVRYIRCIKYVKLFSLGIKHWSFDVSAYDLCSSLAHILILRLLRLFILFLPSWELRSLLSIHVCMYVYLYAYRWGWEGWGLFSLFLPAVSHFVTKLWKWPLKYFLNHYELVWCV